MKFDFDARYTARKNGAQRSEDGGMELDTCTLSKDDNSKEEERNDEGFAAKSADSAESPDLKRTATTISEVWLKVTSFALLGVSLCTAIIVIVLTVLWIEYLLFMWI